MSKGKRLNLKPNKKKKNKTSIYFFIELFFIIIIIISSVYIYKWFIDNRNNKIIQNNLSNLVTKGDFGKYNINFKDLKSQNSDTIAWLKVNNTNIDYPVVKCSDNNYYLNHSFDKTKNNAGWIFFDYKNKFDGKDKNIIIYGHNRKDGTMFGSAKKFLTPEWYDNSDNRIIYLVFENQNVEYEVFSVYQIENEDYYIRTSFNDSSSFENFVLNLKNRSIKDFNVNITKDCQILTLSTCGSTSKTRIVLHAIKLVK